MIVKVISSKDGKSVIEWLQDSRLTRSIIPTADIGLGNDVAHPEYGMQYGIDFKDYVTLTVTPQDIQDSLNNAGIWTVEDFLTRHNEAQGAIMAAYGAAIKDLLRSIQALAHSVQ